MRRILMQKRGDVPVFILVLGVVALVALAILSFVLSNSRNPRDFASLALIEEANSKIDQYYFYQDGKIGVQKGIVAEVLDLQQLGDRWFVNVSGTINGKHVEVIYPYYPLSLD